MKWQSILLILSASLAAGCQSQPPAFDPYIGYGAPTVAPPATGSYGRPDTYYQGGTPQANPQAQPAGSAAVIGPQNSQVIGSGVALASAQANIPANTQQGINWRPAGSAPIVDGNVQTAANIAPSLNATQSSSLNLNGMHVNDATRVAASIPAASNQRVIQFNQATPQTYAYPPGYTYPNYAYQNQGYIYQQGAVQPMYQAQPTYQTAQPTYQAAQPQRVAPPPALLPQGAVALPIPPQQQLRVTPGLNNGAQATPWQPRFATETQGVSLSQLTN